MPVHETITIVGGKCGCNFQKYLSLKIMATWPATGATEFESEA
jgi:hypothetical protein